jgi:DNA-binding NarL/FixJ family response regulator/anti-sigma regulatory factor (Ser/Thr protein kinase)
MARILMIDPEPHLLEALAASPVLGGHDIVAAHGDIDALRRLRFQAFDVVITSPSTTVEEDLVLIEEIRKIRPGARSVVLTGRATREEVVAALSARVFAVFSRPFDAEEVAAMVSGAAASAPGHDGILILSALPDWLAVRLDCSLLTAERLLRYIAELRTEVPDADREGLLIAYREVLLSAIEHGAGRASGKLVDVAAVRTQRAIVFYVRDPGPGFLPLRLPPGLDGRTIAEPEFVRHEGDHHGHAEAYRLLVARTIVDEMLYNERADEVILIKHTE